jgi:hypothetical protein
MLLVLVRAIMPQIQIDMKKWVGHLDVWSGRLEASFREP